MSVSRYCTGYDCVPEGLCEVCLRAYVDTSRKTCRAVGELWARRVFRRPEYAHEDTWPLRSPKALAIARRLVAEYAQDPRLLNELAQLCLEGAAEWWTNRWRHRRG